MVVSDQNSHLVSLLGQRRGRQCNPQSQGCTGAWNSFNLELPVEQKRALLHSNQAERPARFGLLRVKASSVVVNLKEQLVRFPFQARFDARGVSMARDIGERLLKDAENGRGSFRIEVEGFLGQCDMAADSSTAFEFLSLPFQGRGQAQVVQGSGPQLGGDSSQGPN